MASKRSNESTNEKPWLLENTTLQDFEIVVGNEDTIRERVAYVPGEGGVAQPVYREHHVMRPEIVLSVPGNYPDDEGEIHNRVPITDEQRVALESMPIIMGMIKRRELSILANIG